MVPKICSLFKEKKLVGICITFYAKMYLNAKVKT